MAHTFEFVLHFVGCVTVTVSPNQIIIIHLLLLILRGLVEGEGVISTSLSGSRFNISDIHFGDPTVVFIGFKYSDVLRVKPLLGLDVTQRFKLSILTFRSLREMGLMHCLMNKLFNLLCYFNF